MLSFVSLSMECFPKGSVLLTVFYYLASCTGNNSTVLDGLIYQDFNTRSNHSENIYELFEIFALTTTLCIISKNYDHLLSKTIKYCQESNKSLFVIDSDIISLEPCESVVVLELSGYKNCKYIVSRVSTSPLYIIYSSSYNLTYLRSCLSYATSTEVVVLSLSEGKVTKLGPPNPPPRSLASSGVDQVLLDRLQPLTDLQGAVVTVATIIYPPFVIYNNPNVTADFDGLDVVLAKELARQLNFTLRFVIYDVSGSASWIEKIREAFKEVEFTVMNLWQIAPTLGVADFGPSMNKVYSALIVRRPEVIDFQWREFLKLFQLEVWAATLASFLFVIAVFWVSKNCHIHSSRKSWVGSVFVVFSHFALVPSDSDVTSSPARFTVTGWSLFEVLMTSAMSGGIVTRLTIPLYTARVDTIGQMVGGGYYWSAQYYYTANKSEELVNALFDMEDYWERMFEQTYKYMDSEELIRHLQFDKKLAIPVQVFQDGFLTVDADDVGGLEALRQFRLAKEVISGTHVTFSVRKHSPLLETLTRTALRFQQLGLPKYWRDEVLRRWPMYDTKQLLVELDINLTSEPEVFRLYQLQPVFVLLVLGLTVDFLIFLIEMVVFTYYQL